MKRVILYALLHCICFLPVTITSSARDLDCAPCTTLPSTIGFTYYCKIV
jgi:hypothetical protein